MIQLCSFRNTIHQRTGIGTIGSVMEDPVLLAQTKCPDGTLRSRIINRDIRCGQEELKLTSLPESFAASKNKNCD